MHHRSVGIVDALPTFRAKTTTLDSDGRESTKDMSEVGLLSEKVVLLTGAAGGLGSAYARAFLKEGAKLALVDAGFELDGRGAHPERVAALGEELTALGGNVLAISNDVATSEGANEAVDRALAHFSRIDILVTSTGALADRTLLKLEMDDWDRVENACLRATFLATQAFARHAVPRGEGGRVVHTIGLQGLTGSLAQTNFAAANSGIFGLMRSSCIELQKHKITVNAVVPLAKTRMTEHLPMFHGVTTLTPEHVVPAVLYLASDLVGLRTGHLLAVAGARMFSYKFVETNGVFKDQNDGIWSPEEIGEHWDAIVKG